MRYLQTIAIVISVFVSAELLAQSEETVPYRFRKRRTISAFELIGSAGALKNTGYYSDYMMPKYGYSIGAGVIHSFSRSFEIKARALLELKGSKFKIDELGIDLSSGYSYAYTNYYNTSFKYLTVPLMPTFKFGDKKNFIVGFGGYYSWLKGATVKVRKIDQVTQEETRYEVRDMWNFRDRHDIGASLFAGYSIPIAKNNSCAIQVMYNKGFVSSHDFWNGHQRNNSLMLVLTFNIQNGPTQTLPSFSK